MKKVTLALAMAGMVLLGRSAMATNPGTTVDVEVWAQMNQALQITITGATTYNFGTLTSNQQAVMTTSFDVQNTGGGLTETYALRAYNTAAWTLHTAAGNPPADFVALDAQFNSVAPLAASFVDATDRLTTAAGGVPADGTKFAGDQDGKNSPFGSTDKLWLRITAPASSSAAAAQRIQVDIAAGTP